MIEGPILLVGGGKMGGALLEGWLKGGLKAEDALVVEPDAAQREALTRLGAGRVVATAEALGGVKPRAIVLAVKPQVMDEVAPPYAAMVGAGTLVLSIAAGRTIAGFERVFGDGQPIVRAMPNTPAAIGAGITVLCANRAAGEADRALAGSLMEAVGEAVWIEDEEMMHVVTALSGGGPAYVFLLAEALAAAGERQGLPADLARRLARRTVAGSGRLLETSDQPPGQLRRNVTSPGGTTAAALDVLMREEGVPSLIDAAIAAAAARSRELG